MLQIYRLKLGFPKGISKLRDFPQGPLVVGFEVQEGGLGDRQEVENPRSPPSRVFLFQLTKLNYEKANYFCFKERFVVLLYVQVYGEFWIRVTFLDEFVNIQGEWWFWLGELNTT